MGWFAGALGAALLAAVAAIAGLVRHFGENARAVERKLGEARGEVARLRTVVEERERELRAVKTALEHALRPRPPLDELQRVAAEQAGGDLPADAASRVRVP